MKIFNFLVCVLAFLMFSMESSAQKLNHVLGEIIVEVRNDKGAQKLLSSIQSNSRFSTVRYRQILKTPMNLWVLRVDAARNNEIEFLDRVLKDPNTLLAQKNHITKHRSTIPNDPKFSQQWQFINDGSNGGVEDADLDIELAWDITTGGVTSSGDSIVVCIIDDGIVNTNEDWGDNLWINHQEIPDNGLDDDGNGYIDDVRGWNVSASDDNVYQGGGHGSAVAGIVGAKGNNGIGVVGVNWDVKMMIVRGGSPESVALASYGYPYNMRKLYNETNGEKGAFVVSTNASWGIDGGNPEDAPIWCDFYNILGEVGILNFGATANAEVDVDAVGDLPTGCSSEYLVAVTNIDKTDTKVDAAGYGLRTIDIGAFGAGTYTISSNDYGPFGGTSGATPHVAGTAALMYSTDCSLFNDLLKADPAKTALLVKDMILNSVDPNPSLQGKSTSGGRLNVNRAIQALISMCGDCSEAYGLEIISDNIGSANINWVDDGNVGTVDMRYRAIGDSTWIEISNVTNNYELVGLAACVDYEYEMRTICNDTIVPEYGYTKVFKTDGCCTLPDNIDISLNGTVATLTYDSVSAASSYYIEYKNLRDSMWTVVDNTSTSFQIDGIEECSNFEVRIKSLCSSTLNESELSNVFIVSGDCGACSKDYCEFNPKNNNDEWISEVSIDGIFSNLSQAAANGYENYFTAFDINLLKGKQYQLAVAPGYRTNSFDEYFAVYLDYNQDNQFTNEEEIFKSTATQSKVYAPFVIPEDAVEGNTRLRVVMRYNQQGDACDDNFQYGEVEDYCVQVSVSECPTSYNAAVTKIDFESLTFEIPLDDRAEQYVLEYKAKDSFEFRQIVIDSSIFFVGQLEECTMYEYRSSVVCAGEILEFTEIAEVTTKCETSLEEGTGEKTLIFPNPVSEQMTIQNSEFNWTSISIIDINGQRLRSKSNSQHQTLQMLNVSDLSSGVYFIEISNNDRRVLKKFFKL